MPKLDVFVAPQPWPAFAKAMSWVNRILMLHGMPLLRDVPGLRRVPGLRGLADVRKIHLPAADLDRLKAICASGGATFLLPNHPEFFTDWMLDKEIISRAAPECASWATNGVVNGMGAALQKFWLWNNLVAQIPGNSAPAREHSVNWALKGKSVLLHPEGAVGWHADLVAPLMPGAAAMALDAKAKSPATAVRLVPIVWKLAFVEDAAAGLMRECAYVEKSLKLDGVTGEHPADRVHSIFHRLFDREAVKAGIDGWSYGWNLRDKRDGLSAKLAADLESWIGDGHSGRDAAVAIQLAKKKTRLAEFKDTPEAKIASKLADRLGLVARVGDFAFAQPQITAEQVAEHIKRLRNDWCKGSWRDTANKFIPQPVARRHAHIRVLEPVEVSGGEDPAHVMGQVRHAMQSALDEINAVLAAQPGRVAWASLFYLPDL
ncbi:MAG: hypothetical protein WCC66_11380 [Rhizobiaceae bacterium]